MNIDEHWNDLVTAALLGTDRRDPPDADGLLADLVADTVRPDPSSRMLAQVAACTAVRRAGVLPGASLSPLVAAPEDDRPVCSEAAAQRWRHITVSWPVLEDEWTLTLIDNGWRAAPELVPAMLRRHRRDPLRRTRAIVAAGPLATWLVEHLPDLEPIGRNADAPVNPEFLGSLPELPIPPDIAELVDRAGAEIGGTVAVGLEARTFAEPHRAVLVNLFARCAPDALADAAEVLDAVDPMSPGRGLASVLVDLATTRRRMLDELAAN